MTITLTHMQTFGLAKEFAEEILNRVREQRLELTGTSLAWESPCYGDLQAAIRSIPDKYERAEFLSSLRYWLSRLRADAGMPVRGRDYIAAVQTAHQQRAAIRTREAA